MSAHVGICAAGLWRYGIARFMWPRGHDPQQSDVATKKNPKQDTRLGAWSLLPHLGFWGRRHNVGGWGAARPGLIERHVAMR